MTTDTVYRFRSQPLDQPIEELTVLQRSLLFAELAWVAYLSEESAATVVDDIGLRETLFFERDGSQAYIFKSDTDCIVACRGTEPTEWNDIRADVNAVSALAETAGRVHRGFKQEVDDLWPRLEKALIENTRTLWFTGHSLGGAMATICAGRCFLAHIDSNPKQLYTYGSPRVGDNRFVNHVKLEHFRWVNNNDVVTRVPPVWMGYRHTGTQMYLDSQGALRKVSRVQRARDRWRGFWGGLKNGKLDHFSDHSMNDYIQHIERAVNAEKDGKLDPNAAQAIAAAQ